MHTFILDCDPGIDDAIAIILAHSVATVKGITTVHGNVSLDKTTSNALQLVDFLGAETPIYAGADSPLIASTRHAEHVHGPDGLGGLQHSAHNRIQENEHAVEYLLDAVTLDDWVVAVGPLTNLAQVIEKDREWVQRIAGISIMGGGITGGNVTPAAEFNIYCDPEAAAAVFTSGAEIRMCGLNLTNQFSVTDDTLTQLTSINTKRSEFACKLVHFLLGAMENLAGNRIGQLHDVCAVLAVTHPELFTFEHLSVQVELTGSLTRGMTVCDERIAREREPANVQVAKTIDSGRALQLLLNSLKGENGS